MTGIYKITNPKGKVYIGQSIDINRRFNEYKKLLCNQSKKLYNSLKKYNPESHKFEILEECNVVELNSKEEYYILKYNSHIDGLNIKLASKPSWTGKKRPEHSDYLKQYGSGLSYLRTEQHKNNMSNIMKSVWSERREDIIQKIKINKIGKKTKSIKCNETGIIYSSIKECSEQMSISKGILCSFVKGKYKYSNIKGFTFSYSEDLET
jgi:group I intron endonuclease